MRTISTICFLFLLSLCITAQQGVKFEELTFNEALIKAKENKKMVFIDCYTSWCGPCKVMANEEFTKKEAQEYFEPRFVSVKFDMEKGEGIELTKKFNVTSFPTFLIISPEGKELHRIVGGSKINEFIQKVDKGLNQTTALTYLDELYKNGKLELTQYGNYLAALSNAGREAESDKLLTELWNKLRNCQ